jgi:hypothetical protein
MARVPQYFRRWSCAGNVADMSRTLACNVYRCQCFLVARFSDLADLEPARRRDGSREFRRLVGLLAQPLAALAGPGYCRAGGTARSGQLLETGCSRMPSGRISRPRSWTGPGGRPRPVMTAASGGWRSGRPRITSISWRRWPDRTLPGRDLERLLPSPGSLPARRAATRAPRHRPGGPHRSPARAPRGDGAVGPARLG